MKGKRRHHSTQFKVNVALAAVKGDQTVAELAGKYQVHATQITQWKKQLLEALPEIFSHRRQRDQQEQDELTAQLYQQIGPLKVELDGLKKNLDWTREQKRAAIEPGHRHLSIYRQCELLGLPRSSLYYRLRPETDYNEILMRLMDEPYLKTPFYGVDKMTEWLGRQGHRVNPKRVRRLLRLMGLEAIYPRSKRGLSIPDQAHKVYPYLLNDVEILRPNQVWAADITYIRMYRGWLYLMAIMDWFSRYVVAWEVSITLEADFCVAALKRALERYRPEIMNTDQGSQFTGFGWTDTLQASGVAISMDGRGRVFDNIFMERLWRTVKVEEVYLRDYQTPAEARVHLGQYLTFYNEERLHQSLGYRTPAEVFGVAAVPPVALRAPSGTAAVNPGMNPSKKSIIFV